MDDITNGYHAYFYKEHPARNSMLIGLLGKPSTGKSTFFKAATLAEVEISARPFTTLKATEGEAYVKIPCVEDFFHVRCQPRYGFCIQGNRFVPIRLMDVPGLVKDAHLGKGLGNQFLDELNQADALIHIVDCAGATNEKGEPCEPGTNDPVADVEFLERELDMWFLRILKKGWEKFARTVQQEKLEIVKALAKQLSGLKVRGGTVKEAIKEMKPDPTAWSEHDLLQLAAVLRQATKPIIVAANKIDLPKAHENLERLRKTFPRMTIVPCAADSELALREAARKRCIDYVPGAPAFEIVGTLSDQQQQALEYIRASVLSRYNSTGVQEILNCAVFKLLRHIAVFPGGIHKLEDKDGRVLPDCFLLPEHATALDFAFTVHSDLGNNFVRAIDVRTKKVVGKEHHLHHLDVIEIVARR